eukprot:TRINITY_DN2445_c0_g1_i1.p1 TRINITY_DN2445_c0_g1~~TRINITY_DN2445_c0_g1_i1.p1  ORF type:complete len:119 (-),score=2.65 TRINITY_DN2445_c0_g1_i1:131-487(-)
MRPLKAAVLRLVSGLGPVGRFAIVVRLEDVELAPEVGIHHQHSTAVLKLTAVVAGAKNGHQSPVGEELVSVVHDLMGPDDEVKVCLGAELLDYVGSECAAHTALAVPPSLDTLLGVGP